MSRKGHPLPPGDAHVVRTWIALIGPLAVYVVYFALVYLLGEAGCKNPSLNISLFGSPLVTSLSVILGILAIAGNLLVTTLAWRTRKLDGETYQFMGTAGLLINALVMLIIVATFVMTIGVPPC